MKNDAKTFETIGKILAQVGAFIVICGACVGMAWILGATIGGMARAFLSGFHWMF